MTFPLRLWQIPSNRKAASFTEFCSLEPLSLWQQSLHHSRIRMKRLRRPLLRHLNSIQNTRITWISRFERAMMLKKINSKSRMKHLVADPFEDEESELQIEMMTTRSDTNQSEVSIVATIAGED